MWDFASIKIAQPSVHYFTIFCNIIYLYLFILVVQETWQEMEKLLDEGKVKAIGISNFSVKKTKELLSYARHKPAANQVELHPYFRNSDISKYCQSQVRFFCIPDPFTDSAFWTPLTSFLWLEACYGTSAMIAIWPEKSASDSSCSRAHCEAVDILSLNQACTSLQHFSV